MLKYRRLFVHKGSVYLTRSDNDDGLCGDIRKNRS
jgi:hypothetical protein